MRRLRDTDGRDQHKRAARGHMGKLTLGGSAIHQTLHAEMKVRYESLKERERAHDDAKDAAVEASAICDFTEQMLENVIRDIDADLGKLDRAEPERNARATVFPEGFGKEIDPDGASQLDNLPTLRGRIEQVGPHPVVTETLAKFDAAVETFKTALKSEESAEALEESLFQEELQARKAIREQLEVAYGKLRAHYKANPRKAEDFFLREGSRRKPK
ncbi:MAG: hypothetical protein IPM54_28075 [Polyangiaceae bacterium]|nr:hypothetical protein [Polyangiaceae bacterium]